MTGISAVLLAAGLSGRMGEVNKLELPIDGKPMIRLTAMHILDAISGSLIVVTGHQADRIRQALEGLTARFAYNKDFRAGQQGSVRVGVAVAPESDSVMICLADQPDLSSNDLRTLMNWHWGATAGQITVPFYRNGTESPRRGNPVILTPEAAHQVRTDALKPGCRMLTERQPERVNKFMTSAKGFFRDVDTPEAYARLTGRMPDAPSSQY